MKIYKAKVTIVVEFSSDEYDNVETMMDELSQECDYTINSTKNVNVMNTEFRDIQLI